MMGIGTWAITSGAEMEQLSLPNEECNASGELIDDVWYYVYDLDSPRKSFIILSMRKNTAQ